MLALVVYTATCAAVLSSPIKVQSQSQSQFPSFQKWSNINGRVYQPTERDYRETIYTQNLATIQSTNNSWTNKFADRTAEEFATYLDCVESKSKTNLRGASVVQSLNSTNQFETNATVVQACTQ
jgi:hypothetical protein